MRCHAVKGPVEDNSCKLCQNKRSVCKPLSSLQMVHLQVPDQAREQSGDRYESDAQ